MVSEDDPSNGSFTPFGLTLASKPTSNVTLELVENSYQTGEIEVGINKFRVLGACKELPLPVFSDQEYSEEIRLKYL